MNEIEKELERNIRKDIEKKYKPFSHGVNIEQAKRNLSYFADTMSKGPKYQERQRIDKLKRLAMLFEPMQPEYITVTIDKKYLGKWGK